MRRIAGTCLLGLALVATGCSSGPSGALKFAVNADAPSAEGKNFQNSAFFPSTLKVSPGDSIVFKNASSQAPHTITFGVDANRSNQPPVVLPNGSLSPVALQPCYTADPPKKDMVECANKKLPAYSGKGFWNSGFLVPAPAPAAAGTKEVTLRVADNIAPGQYRYLCILHGPMVGVLNVVKDEGERETPEAVVKVADTQRKQVIDAANSVKDPELGAGKVAAGWGNNVTAVNRFYPETIEIKAGESVSWEALSSYEPHTVSVGTAYKAGGEAPGVTPEGSKSGSSYTSGNTSSGIFGKKGGPFPPSPFTLTFPTAGEYKYVCVLHPGMQGTVKVT